MTFVIAGVVALAVVAVALVLVRRRARSRVQDAAAATPPPPASRPEPEPMTGLEAALAQVTDRDGRPIGEHIEAEAPLVDELRVPDDTGPVLRRALDRIEHHADEPAHDDDEAGDGAEPPAGDDGPTAS